MQNYIPSANVEEDNICQKQKERYVVGVEDGFIKMQKQNLNMK